MFAKKFYDMLVTEMNDSSVLTGAPGTGGGFGNKDSWNTGDTRFAVALGTNTKIPMKNVSASKSKKKKIIYARRPLNPN